MLFCRVFLVKRFVPFGNGGKSLTLSFIATGKLTVRIVAQPIHRKNSNRVPVFDNLGEIECNVCLEMAKRKQNTTQRAAHISYIPDMRWLKELFVSKIFLCEESPKEKVRFSGGRPFFFSTVYEFQGFIELRCQQNAASAV